MDIAIPVMLSLFLGPGVGQLYNRQYKKGGYLIGLSLLVLGAACLWFFKAMSPYLPPDLATTDRTALQPLVENAVRQVMAGHGHTLATYQTILLALWIYSVIDAYRVAQLLRAKKLSIL